MHRAFKDNNGINKQRYRIGKFGDNTFKLNLQMNYRNLLHWQGTHRGVASCGSRSGRGGPGRRGWCSGSPPSTSAPRRPRGLGREGWREGGKKKRRQARPLPGLQRGWRLSGRARIECLCSHRAITLSAPQFLLWLMQNVESVDQCYDLYLSIYAKSVNILHPNAAGKSVY